MSTETDLDVRITADTRPALEAIIRHTSTRGLLQSIIRLTHMIDRTTNKTLADQYRSQRGVIMDEVQRRTTLHDMALPDPRLPGLTWIGRDQLEEEVRRA